MRRVIYINKISSQAKAYARSCSMLCYRSDKTRPRREGDYSDMLASFLLIFNLIEMVRHIMKNYLQDDSPKVISYPS